MNYGQTRVDEYHLGENDYSYMSFVFELVRTRSFLYLIRN